MAELRNFKLLRGGPFGPAPETYDLNRLLRETDPHLFASLREEERQRRRRLGLAAGLFVVLIAVFALIGTWLRAGVQAGPAPSPSSFASSRKPAAADREHARLLAARGIAALSSGRFEDAQASLELSLQLDPHQTEARNALGRLLGHR